MAKYETKFDLAGAKRDLSRFKTPLLKYIEKNADFKKITTLLEAAPSLSVLIFSKSIAFRIGKGSIKSIPGFPAGFKGSFTNIVSDVNATLASGVLKLPKNKTVTLAAAYFILFYPEKVKLEEDKTEAAESEQVLRTVSTLNSLLKRGESLKITIGKEVYNVDGFKQVQGRPKADAVFTFKNQPVIFCSLKKGKVAGDFQQYGGWSSDLGLNTRQDISNISEVNTFVSRIERIFQALQLQKNTNGRYDFNNFKKGTNFAAYLEDPKLSYKAIFGKNFGTKAWGLDNCQIVLDGDITLVPGKNKTYEIKGMFHTMINPLLSNGSVSKLNVDDTYRPALFVYKSEQQGLNQGSFANARASIWPNNKVIKSYIKKLDNVEAGINKGGSELDRIKKEILK